MYFPFANLKELRAANLAAMKKDNQMYFDGPMGFRVHNNNTATAPIESAIPSKTSTIVSTTSSTVTVVRSGKKGKEKTEKTVHSIKGLVKKLRRSGFPLSKEQLKLVKNVCRTLDPRK